MIDSWPFSIGPIVDLVLRVKGRHAGAGSDDRFVDELNLSVRLLHLSQMYANQMVGRK